MDNMFEKLLKLPLFQGVSQEKISRLVEKIPFHFLKFSDGEKIISADEDCTHLKFVVSGSVKLVTSSKVVRVSLSQTLNSPAVIGPDFLFGRKTVYPYDVYAMGACGILQILKNDYMQILQSDKVFLFNILNFLARSSQGATFAFQAQSRGLVAERLATLVASLTWSDSSGIVLDFRQKDLGSLLGVRRTSLINALNDLKKKQIIDYGVGQITIKDRQEIMKILKSNEK